MRKPTENKSALIGMNHDIKTLANGVLCMSSLLENTTLNVEQAEIVQLLRKSLRNRCAAERNGLTGL